MQLDNLKEKSTVCYDDFGAVGDGVANDFFALKKAHEFANEHGLTVVATPGKTYRIVNTAEDGLATSIVIKTNTNWTGAKFIIDDSDLYLNKETKEYCTCVFRILPLEEDYDLTDEQIKAINEFALTRETKKINLTFETDVLLLLESDARKTYIRYGGDANDGQFQKECIYVYPDGTMSEKTPLMHDFPPITKVTVTRANLPELTVEGGEFTTIVCQTNTTVNGKPTMVYFTRNLLVERSNTTVKNVKHKVVGELEFVPGKITGASYSGFFSCRFASHVTLDSCTMSARKYYRIAGTYDFGATFANEIHLINCDMYKFYLDNGRISTAGSAYWGVGGTNYCKNMAYDNCTLTRFDAHSGVYNGRISNCTIGIITLIGAGEMLIENTNIVQSNRVFTLRADYGSTWNGNITIRNVTLDNYADVGVTNAPWANHYFGYDCYFPNIIIENLKLNKPATINMVYESDTLEQYTYAHKPTLPSGEKNENVVIPPSFFKITDDYGYTYAFPNQSATFFENTKYIYNDEEK